jgi:hypothetical protein
MQGRATIFVRGHHCAFLGASQARQVKKGYYNANNYSSVGRMLSLLVLWLFHMSNIKPQLIIATQNSPSQSQTEAWPTWNPEQKPGHFSDSHCPDKCC